MAFTLRRSSKSKSVSELCAHISKPVGHLVVKRRLIALERQKSSEQSPTQQQAKQTQQQAKQTQQQREQTQTQREQTALKVLVEVLVEVLVDLLHLKECLSKRCLDCRGRTVHLAGALPIQCNGCIAEHQHH